MRAMLTSKRITAPLTHTLDARSTMVRDTTIKCICDYKKWNSGLEDGGGITTNGTFVNSDITVEFFDPTVQGNFSIGRQDGNYMS